MGLALALASGAGVILSAAAIVLVGWMTGVALFLITVLALAVIVSTLADRGAGTTRASAPSQGRTAFRLVQRVLAYVRPH